eukprot:Skav210459  [mRNA]  locus=scaffold1297:330935:331192:- [translate_table: standard]
MAVADQWGDKLRHQLQLLHEVEQQISRSIDNLSDAVYDCEGIFYGPGEHDVVKSLEHHASRLHDAMDVISEIKAQVERDILALQE